LPKTIAEPEPEPREHMTMGGLTPETPFLAVDLDLLDRNIARMAQIIIRDGGKNWRPHVKAIKTPAIAHKLLAAGAIGVTCAKLSEAEVMVAAGVRDILIANQVVGAAKIHRLANLNRHACVIAAVDHHKNVEEMDHIAASHGVKMPVLIEVDVGLERAGVAPGGAVLSLAKTISAFRHIRFAGVMAWEGHTAAISDPKQKEEAIRRAVDKIVQSAAMCEQAGIAVDIVSCGGTGTYPVTSRIAGVTELQAGGGVFGDIRYRDECSIPHECALTVWTSVISRPKPDRIVCNAGWKAMACFPTLPSPAGLGEIREIKLSAEHTKIDLVYPVEQPRVGDCLQFIVGYSDSTVFLHDTLFAMRDGAVELIWPLLGRGKLQ
jgi:D-serine deaminase-like pyridoxal phosphate-dependent protein